MPRLQEAPYVLPAFEPEPIAEASEPIDRETGQSGYAKDKLDKERKLSKANQAAKEAAAAEAQGHSFVAPFYIFSFMILIAVATVSSYEDLKARFGDKKTELTKEVTLSYVNKNK